MPAARQRVFHTSGLVLLKGKVWSLGVYGKGCRECRKEVCRGFPDAAVPPAPIRSAPDLAAAAAAWQQTLTAARRLARELTRAAADMARARERLGFALDGSGVDAEGALPDLSPPRPDCCVRAGTARPRWPTCAGPSRRTGGSET
jgi:hypothetical protein